VRRLKDSPVGITQTGLELQGVYMKGAEHIGDNLEEIKNSLEDCK